MAESESAKFEAIVLAAGLGARFGGGKLMAPFRGQPLIASALASAMSAPVNRVLVAIGAEPDLEAAVLARGGAAPVAVVRVARAAEGMGASLATAAAALSPGLKGVFVFLGDMPLVGPGIAPALAAALDGPGGIAAPRHAGRRGHPVLFGADWIPALRDLAGDVGAQTLIRQAGDRLVTVETDDAGVLFDIDRPEDIYRG